VKSEKRASEGGISPDLTSFSDIANLLIIFFILTTSLTHPWGKRLEMPSAATPPTDQTKAPKIPTVNLMRDRVVYKEGEGQGKEITMNELNAILLAKKFPELDPKDRSVVLEVAEDVPYQRYYQTVTAISATGGVIAMIEGEEGEGKK
jgi:biopolymer transport protein ExbD